MVVLHASAGEAVYAGEVDAVQIERLRDTGRGRKAGAIGVEAAVDGCLRVRRVIVRGNEVGELVEALVVVRQRVITEAKIEGQVAGDLPVVFCIDRSTYC